MIAGTPLMKKDFVSRWIVTTIVFEPLALMLAGYDAYFDHIVDEGGAAPTGWTVLHPIATVLFFPARLGQLFGFPGAIVFFAAYVALLSVPLAFVWTRVRRATSTP